LPTEKPLSAQEYLGIWTEMEEEKRPWLVLYQAIAEIFFTRKMDFTRVIIPGQFLQADVFDNTAQFALHLAASVFLSMLFPDAGRTFELRPVAELEGLPGVEEYFRWATKKVHRAMEQPKAGLSVAVMEYLLDLLAFGTAGIATLENANADTEPEVPVVYDAWGVKNMNIRETAQGFVDQVYYLRPLTVRQIYIEYSKRGDRIPAKVKELYDAKKLTEKIDVLVVLEPKLPEKTPTGAVKRGVAGMAYRTVHIAKDMGEIMRVGGYHENPVAVGRQFKSLDEALGRSSAMVALPDAQSANVLTEAVLVASEKQLDPPLVVLDSGRLGGGVVDTSANAINVYDTGGRISNEKPIQPLFTVGEFQHALDTLKALRDKVLQAFFLDRLLDTNNQTQMTAYETSVRDHKNGQAMGGVFSRQQKEVFTPTIQRTFNVMFRGGYLGIVKDGLGGRLRAMWVKITGSKDVIVPDVILKAHKAGLDIFEVRYISPAARFQQSEKLRGIMTASDLIAALAPVMPGITDNVDGDKVAHHAFKFAGAPMDCVRTEDALKKFRAANAKQQGAQADLDGKEQQANIGLKAAQARAALGTATPIAPGLQPAGAK
jgi:hypothetical protein